MSCSASGLESMEAHTEGKKSSTSGFTLTIRETHRNPLGCAIATTALDILIDERLSERAAVLQWGEVPIQYSIPPSSKKRGLLNAVVVDESKSTRCRTAWQLCLLLKSRGVLAKPTHVNMCDL